MAKVKIYRSGTRLATTLMLGRNKVHVSFNPTSDGGSTLTVTDPALQAALEASPLCGRWFRLWKEHDEPDEVKAVASSRRLRTVEVASESEAKDYLAEHCGVQRGRLRSHAQIKAAAEKAGISFKGI